jgi:hypothetical protein
MTPAVRRRITPTPRLNSAMRARNAALPTMARTTVAVDRSGKSGGP